VVVGLGVETAGRKVADLVVPMEVNLEGCMVVGLVATMAAAESGAAEGPDSEVEEADRASWAVVDDPEELAVV